MLAGVAVYQSIHAYLNPRAADGIAQAIDPRPIDFGLFDAHALV